MGIGIYIRVIGVFIALFILCGAGGHAEDKVRIGVSLPLSGDSANEGEDLRSMLQYANQHVLQSAYELIFEDDQCNNTKAVSIAHKFAGVDKVKYVVGFACSGAVLASAPVYDKAHVTVIALATGAPAISQAGDYIFRTIPSLNIAAVRLYDHAAAHYKKVGILSEETDYCQGLEQAFTAQNKGGRLQIVSQSYAPGTADFKSLFARMKAAGVEALFINPQAEAGYITIFQQLKQTNWQVPLYGTYYPGFSLFLQSFGSQADGIVFADLPFLSSALNDQGHKMFADYTRQYGAAQSSEFYFVTSFAALLALDQAIKSKEDVKGYLYTHPFEGFFGKYSFDANGDVLGDKLTFVLKIIRQGKAVDL